MVAEELHASQRHVQRLWAEYNKAGTAHVQRHAGRPKNNGPTSEEIRTVLDAYDSKPQGVVRTVKNLRKAGCNTSHPRICKIMKSNGLVVASANERFDKIENLIIDKIDSLSRTPDSPDVPAGIQGQIDTLTELKSLRLAVNDLKDQQRWRVG